MIVGSKRHIKTFVLPIGRGNGKLFIVSIHNRKMNTEILNEIGFSDAEKKVYLTLLELGMSTAAPILEKTGLQNSVLYRTIHRLIEKGFVSFIKKGKIKHYKASNPEVILTYHRERGIKLKKLIPELKKRQKKSETEEAEVYSGFKGVKTMLYSLIEDGKKGEECYFFGQRAEIYTELQKRLYLAYDLYRSEKKIKVFGIHDISVKRHMKKGRYSIMRYVRTPIPQTMVIFRNKIALIAWGNLEKPTGILISSKEMATQYKGFFKELWKIAKP